MPKISSPLITSHDGCGGSVLFVLTSPAAPSPDIPFEFFDDNSREECVRSVNTSTAHPPADAALETENAGDTSASPRGGTEYRPWAVSITHAAPACPPPRPSSGF